MKFQYQYFSSLTVLKILTFLAAAEMSNCHFCTEITIENKSVVKIMETGKFDLFFAQTKNEGQNENGTDLFLKTVNFVNFFQPKILQWSPKIFFIQWSPKNLLIQLSPKTNF